MEHSHQVSIALVDIKNAYFLEDRQFADNLKRLKQTTCGLKQKGRKTSYVAISSSTNLKT
jgi:hypothetical protein